MALSLISSPQHKFFQQKPALFDCKAWVINHKRYHPDARSELQFSHDRLTHTEYRGPFISPLITVQDIFMVSDQRLGPVFSVSMINSNLTPKDIKRQLEELNDRYSKCSLQELAEYVLDIHAHQIFWDQNYDRTLLVLPNLFVTLKGTNLLEAAILFPKVKLFCHCLKKD